MRLTTLEHDVLHALTRTPADCGAYISTARLAKALPSAQSGTMDGGLCSLKHKQLVKVDEHGCVSATELGVAALKSM